jgi:putative ABC transport system permease protein
MTNTTGNKTDREGQAGGGATRREPRAGIAQVTLQSLAVVGFLLVVAAGSFCAARWWRLGSLAAGDRYFRQASLGLYAGAGLLLAALLSLAVLCGIALMAVRSLRQHWLSSAITALSVALGCGLVMAIVGVQKQAYSAFTGGTGSFDAILGARGSELQLVLNSVFHLETSPGNVAWADYLRFKTDPMVKLAIPYAVGDNYHGFRIIGTTADLFTKYEPRPGKRLAFQPGGGAWTRFNPERWEAVIGSYAAQKTGLRVGDKFHAYHGLVFDAKMMHSDVYEVTGIMAATNTPMDRAIWVPLDSYYLIEKHRPEGWQPGDVVPDTYKQVSAVMLKFRVPTMGVNLAWQINRQPLPYTLVCPIAPVMVDLMDKIGWIDQVLTLVAYLVVAVAAGSILASLYNTMNERRREFAILRALGARRATVFAAIVLEAAAIAALGAVAAFGVYALLLAGAATVLRAQTGVVLSVWSFNPVLVLAPLGMIALGALAGIIPAVKAYATDVASNLGPTS